MMTPQQTVDSMSSDARARSAFEDFLRVEFAPPRRRWPLRWFSRTPDFRVVDVKPWDDGGAFVHSCVFRGEVADPQLLEIRRPPSGPSSGLFALGASSGFCYLHHRPEHVSALLRAEGRSLLQLAPPLVLAQLLAACLLRKGSCHHHVLASADELAKHLEPDGPYHLSLSEWDRVHLQVVAPSFSSPGELTFCSTSGELLRTETLSLHTYRFADDFGLSYAGSVLSSRIFDRVPADRR